MANDTNLTIVGNLTADPELRFTTSGVAVAKFTVAQTPRTFDKASNSYKDGEPLFLTCTAWRELAEHTAESLTRGARVVVTGRLKLSRWETPEGDKRSAYGLDVDDIGPSLRFATAKVQKMTRTNNGNTGPAKSRHHFGPDEPWSATAPTHPDNTPIDDEPPF